MQKSVLAALRFGVLKNSHCILSTTFSKSEVNS